MDRRIKDSRKQEKDGAKRWGGKVNSGSGNGEKFKGDMRAPDRLIEYKTTRGSSFKLNIDDLTLAWRNATLDNRDPVFGIEYKTDYPRVGPARWALLPEDDLLALRNRIQELEEQMDSGGSYF